MCQGNSNDLVRFAAHTLLTFVVFDSSYSVLDMYTGISLSRSCVSNARGGGWGGGGLGWGNSLVSLNCCLRRNDAMALPPV